MKPSDHDDEERWRQQLAQLGPEAVRTAFHHGYVTEGHYRVNISGVDWPAPTKAFIESWLREQSNAVADLETRRYRAGLVIGIIGMVAAVIAAICSALPYLRH